MTLSGIVIGTPSMGADPRVPAKGSARSEAVSAIERSRRPKPREDTPTESGRAAFPKGAANDGRAARRSVDPTTLYLVQLMAQEGRPTLDRDPSRATHNRGAGAVSRAYRQVGAEPGILSENATFLRIRA